MVAKTANIAKIAEKCINCISARPTPPHTNPMESGPGNTFSAQIEKNQKIHDFQPKKRGGHFFDIFDPPPPPPPHPHPHPPPPPKSGFQVGGGLGGVRTKKLIGGCVYWTK